MFEKKIQYTDYNGTTHTEVLYFHLMAPEVTELGFDPNIEGGFRKYVQGCFDAGDNLKIIALLKLLVVSSYGKRSPDGESFVKDPKFTRDLLNNPAYEEFMVWLIDDAKNAEQLWNGLILKWVSDKFGNKTKTIHDMSVSDLDQIRQNKLVAPSAK